MSGSEKKDRNGGGLFVANCARSTRSFCWRKEGQDGADVFERLCGE